MYIYQERERDIIYIYIYIHINVDIYIYIYIFHQLHCLSTAEKEFRPGFHGTLLDWQPRASLDCSSSLGLVHLKTVARAGGLARAGNLESILPWVPFVSPFLMANLHC